MATSLLMNTIRHNYAVSVCRGSTIQLIKRCIHCATTPNVVAKASKVKTEIPSRRRKEKLPPVKYKPYVQLDAAPRPTTRHRDITACLLIGCKGNCYLYIYSKCPFIINFVVFFVQASMVSWAMLSTDVCSELKSTTSTMTTMTKTCSYRMSCHHV